MSESYAKNGFGKTGRPRRPLPVTVRAVPGGSHRGLLSVGGAVFPCALGRTGVSAFKREGDGATPLARMRVLGGYRRGTAPENRLGLRTITAALGWCDAPGDRNYNRPVALPYAASHERMLRPDGLYDIVLVLDWNVFRRSRNRGSAIFLHLALPGYRPTEGCIAVSRATMRRLLGAIGPGSEIRVTR